MTSTRAFPGLRRWICLLRGHEAVLQFEPRRLALRCCFCGRETPGWTLGTSMPNICPDDAIRARRSLPESVSVAISPTIPQQRADVHGMW